MPLDRSRVGADRRADDTDGVPRLSAWRTAWVLTVDAGGGDDLGAAAPSTRVVLPAGAGEKGVESAMLALAQVLGCEDGADPERIRLVAGIATAVPRWSRDRRAVRLELADGGVVRARRTAVRLAASGRLTMRRPAGS